MENGLDKKIKFSKMHGLGNDFVVLDAINQSLDLSNEQMRFIADRHFGIGCDQILLVESSDNSGVDFRYRIFNADGGEVEQCGNGARCFARFVLDKKLTDKQEITVETNSGIIVLEALNSGWVRVNMGVPQFKPANIPLAVNQEATKYEVEANGNKVSFGSVSMGNPHAVIEVDNVQAAPVLTLGGQLESHTVFPQRANIGFMEVENKSRIKLRVFERGVGETLACGTGACAAVVIGQKWNKLNKEVQVELPGGELLINWDGENEPVFLSGPASFVFDGSIDVPV